MAAKDNAAITTAQLLSAMLPMQTMFMLHLLLPLLQCRPRNSRVFQEMEQKMFYLTTFGLVVYLKDGAHTVIEAETNI
ncbi:hypothetical protein OROGR_014770 [Orobanche gracilis]